MISYNKTIKSVMAISLMASMLTFISCENSFSSKKINTNLENNKITSTDAKANLSIEKSNIIDWTHDRVYKNNKNFSIKASSDSLKTKLGTTQSFLDGSKIINGSNTLLTGLVTVTAGSTTLEGNQTNFNSEVKPGDKILIESTGEILEIASVPPAPTPLPGESIVSTSAKLNLVSAPTKTSKDSRFRVYVNKNVRGKNFGAMTISPAIDLNGAGSGDDVLYYTSDNTTGANFFAMSSDGRTLWEHGFSGTFLNSNPTFSSNKTYLSKKVMYVVSNDGNLYCLNTDGSQAAQIKINDTFMNSVWIDSSDSTFDYVYLASMTGNLYKLRLQFSNSQQATFTLEYSKKIDSTSFVSSPVMNGSSLYLGGENGTMYDVITTTGDVSRSWDLSTFTKNGAAKITANPVVGSSNTVLVPAGGYLFRIQGSNVTQSPLLEAKYDLNSRNKPYGAVFPNSNTNNPNGSIASNPVVNGNMVYVANGNTLFELDYSNNDTFRSKANYCVSATARLDENSSNLTPYGKNNIAISTGADGVTKVAMLDTNIKNNSTPFMNFFSIPLASDKDALARYGYFNEFDSDGKATTGSVSSAIADASGNIYFSLDNGTVNVIKTP
ncbi:MAG: PQQ-binding-like beta-propeller repeat protein [Candidatus Sericytochromatia bacterium]